jgi:hypothetical protein
MRKSRFTEEQIVVILKEGEAGVAVADLPRRHDISRATYFTRPSNYTGMWRRASTDEGGSRREHIAEADVR